MGMWPSWCIILVDSSFFGSVPVALPVKNIIMIVKLSTEEAKATNYVVKRPFMYKAVQYFKGDFVEATNEDLKFLIRNNLIS